MRLPNSFVAVLIAAILAASLPAEEESAATLHKPERNFENDVRPVLSRHCLGCHGEDEPKKAFRIDQLKPDFHDADSRRQWLSVYKRVKSGEMPPKSEPRPSSQELADLAGWIQQQEAARVAAEGRTVLRRLNRVEYENTLRDLLGIEIEVQELFPADSAGDGFDTVGEAQHVSSFLMQRYLDAADKALNLAIANTPQPPLVKKRYYCHETHTVKLSTESVYRRNGDALVLFSSSPWNAVTLSPFYPPNRGLYRFRISAAAVQSGGRPVTYRVEAGPMLMGTKNHLIGYFDAPPPSGEDKEGGGATAEFVDHLEARSTIRIQPYGLAVAQTVNKIGADKYEGPGLEVHWIDVEGPLHESWPPASHRHIFGDLPQEKRPSRTIANYVEVVSQDPAADAERILRRFAHSAFRRPVTNEELEPILALVEQKRAEGYSFERAVRVGLERVLLAPQFLYLPERPGVLDDFALASRLSYFLWSTLPDAELLELASAGRLNDSVVLREQVDRMLNSPRAAEFTKNFVGQWLGLRDIDFTEPDRRLYPEYDDMLRAAMVQETHLFFDEVLRNDLSLTNFVASDFTFLNERLAKHYGIAGVEGHAMRKVALAPEAHRGGMLTMASVLKVTANGTNTSPVVRGAWVLSRILGTPPEPPPGEVPAIEPDIRGATTIREQLARHREIESCASCHVKIDPPGFALESYDVIGGWREHYRSVGNGKPVTIDGTRMPYLQGPAVNAADVLADGRPFANVDELKQLLAADKDQLARSLAHKLVTYATGRAPQVSDEGEIETQIAKARDKNYGFRTLVHELVQSRLFREK